MIKVSHHGSNGNTSPELLSLIDSKYFIISTNGMSYNHPDLACLARIVCRPIQDNSQRTLIFNYTTTEAYKEMQNPAWQGKT